MPSWYYEYGGKKIGPVPGETLRHLADHSAIKPDTSVWRDGMDTPVAASKIKNLFPASAGDIDVARTYLSTVLDAVMDEDEARLEHHDPHLMFFHASTVSGVLVAYKILSIVPKTPPIFDPSLSAGEQTKPVRQLFDANVRATFCDRPHYACSLAELREKLPGRRDEVMLLKCKQFTDGDWIFIDGTLGD
jgi:hypothetical protein